jgi:branched-chain amino acid transport system permease protein
MIALIGRHRVLAVILILALLPWIIPSHALAVNILIYGLYAVGFNLLFGYTGLLSFGHAAFFGGGAYFCGIAMVRFGLGWLPALLSGVALSGLLATGLGALSIRSRGVYFSMVTLALGQMVYYLAYQATDWTGGENGLRGINLSHIDLGPLQINFLDPVSKFYVILAFVAPALWFVSRVLNSPFGAVIEAVRENESRARACGYDVQTTKLLSFILSGLICGLAGALNALHLSIVPIDSLGYHNAGLPVMMALLGGMGTFFGPFIGAALFLLIENLTSLVTPHWQLFAGLAFILAVRFLPRGLWGGVLARVSG